MTTAVTMLPLPLLSYNLQVLTAPYIYNFPQNHAIMAHIFDNETNLNLTLELGERKFE